MGKFKKISISFVYFLFISNSYLSSCFEGEECGRIDVRNKPTSLEQLRRCSVIKGSLSIVLIQGNLTECDYANYTFPLLKEVTEFVIFYDVAGLTSFQKLFPNLAVIRGRKLFLNYALGIYAMPHLKEVGLKSLISIQRGHVFIDRCPNLCFLDKINWGKITSTPGTNHIKSENPSDCNELCIGCDHCWSNENCQRFENDNLENIKLGSAHCHENCIGGCKNSTNRSCFLCKTLTDNGACVKQCPENKFISKDDYRCYTRKQCIQRKRIIHNKECVKYCPTGFTLNEEIHECVPCEEDDSKCLKICAAKIVNNLEEAEYYSGCAVVNGTLNITIENTVNESDLENSFSSIQKITGYLMISRTLSITSFAVLKNLREISGEELYYGRYSLVIYGNKNLEKLWQTDKTSLNIAKGSMLIYSNYKLCNNEIVRLKKFSNHVSSADDFIDYNELEEDDCNQLRINITIQSITFNSADIFWKINGKVKIIDIYYRESRNFSFYVDPEEDECASEPWIKDSFLVNTSTIKEEYFHYKLRDLQQNTEYQFFVKVTDKIGAQLKYLAQSEVKYFKTLLSVPNSPSLKTSEKSENSITLKWNVSVRKDNKIITLFLLHVYEHPDRREVLDTRNYCQDPPSRNSYELEDDYDNCCSLKEDLNDNEVFANSLEKDFGCYENFAQQGTLSSDFYQHRENSKKKKKSGDTINIISTRNEQDSHIMTLTIPSGNTNVVVENLEHFTLYTFEFFACNDIGCGPYTLHSERTAPRPEADNITLTITLGSRPNVYVLHFHQPKNPNGVTLSYIIIYRKFEGRHFLGSIECITRLEHERNSFKYSAVLTSTNYEVRVRSLSLAGHGLFTPWVNISMLSGNKTNTKDIGDTIVNINESKENNNFTNKFSPKEFSETLEANSYFETRNALVISFSIIFVGFLFGSAYLIYKNYYYILLKLNLRRETDEEILLQAMEDINKDNLNNNNSNDENTL